MRSQSKAVALSARIDDVHTGYRLAVLQTGSALSNHMQLKAALVQMHPGNRLVGSWQVLAFCADADFAQGSHQHLV